MLEFSHSQNVVVARCASEAFWHHLCRVQFSATASSYTFLCSASKHLFNVKQEKTIEAKLQLALP